MQKIASTPQRALSIDHKYSHHGYPRDGQCRDIQDTLQSIILTLSSMILPGLSPSKLIPYSKSIEDTVNSSEDISDCIRLIQRLVSDLHTHTHCPDRSDINTIADDPCVHLNNGVNRNSDDIVRDIGREMDRAREYEQCIAGLYGQIRHCMDDIDMYRQKYAVYWELIRRLLRRCGHWRRNCRRWARISSVSINWKVISSR